MRKETRCVTCNQPLHKDCSIKENDQHYCDTCFTVKTEEKPVLTFAIPDVIRRSYIEDYRSCPYKFYLTVVKGILDEKETIYNRMGSDLHELFEKACKDREYIECDMLDDFSHMWRNYSHLIEGEEQGKIMINRGMKCINNFYIALSELPIIPHSTEEKIIFGIGENLPQISTTSDRIDLIDNMLELTDWKTGQVMVGNKLSSDMQAPLYIYGAEQKYNIPVRKFTFRYLQEGKTRVFERQPDGSFVCTVRNRIYRIHPSKAITECQSIFSHIIKGHFNIPNDTKKMFYTCKMCHLAKSGHCEGADIQSWKQLN